MNLLSSDDLSREQINKIFSIADHISDGKEELALADNATMALLFEKPSTRTRLSFEVAMAQLNGSAFYIDRHTSQLSRGETIADTAKVLGSYCDFIAARLFKQSDLVELAENAVGVPVINALTDIEHPTQALADLYTIKEFKGSIKNMEIAFIGDIATNTANSLMLTAAKLGANVTLIGPKGYMPNSTYVNKAKEYSKTRVTSSLVEGLEGADIIYTDTYVSMGEEKYAEKRRKLFSGYQVNAKVVSMAKKDAKVMHCLMAHRGEEITSEVLDGPQSIVWTQARNKLLLNKAIILFLSENTK